MKEKLKQKKKIIIITIALILIIGVTITILAVQNVNKTEEGETTTDSISAEISQTNAENDAEVEAIMQKDACGDKVPVPEGYVGSSVDGENEIDTGYVIYEGTEEVTEDNVDEARTTRNQYVWVPVTNTSAFYGTDSNGKKWGKLYTFSESGYSNNNWTETSGIMKITSSTGGREPDVVRTYDSDSYLKTYLSTIGVSSRHEFLMQLEKEFNAMIASVEKYGGFYIGRYEAGNVTESLNAEEAVEVKGNSYIYSTTWYNAYLMCKTLSGDNENVVTGLIWGCQWDRTLIWLVESESKTYSEIVNSTDWGNYSNNTESGAGSRKSTGYSETWKANNIYDLAGNVMEWTMEAVSIDCRVLRGGYYLNSGSNYPSSYRLNINPTNSNTTRRLSCHTLYQVATCTW